MRRWTSRTILAAGFTAGLILLWSLASGRGVPWVGYDQGWSIGVMIGASPLALREPADRPNPVLTAADIPGRPCRFIADPFLARLDDEWLMFFEALERGENKGVIGLARSGDGRAWAFDSIVLSEPFHLSYPFVIEHDSAWWMVPEAAESGSIRLYRAVRFPQAWTFEGTLLEEPLLDPTLVHRDGRWWLFASEGHSTLRLFMAESLRGPFVEHPRSPVVRNDARHARPAGRMIEWSGSLYRLAQDDAAVYGRAVRAFRILELTSETYDEEPASEGSILGPGDSGSWNALGMHHMDAARQQDGSWLAVVDGNGRRLRFGWDR
jgi:hypothetical protein